VFILLFLLKSILSYFILAPSAFSDSYIYAKIGRSVFFTGELSVHGLSVDHLPLYPIILSLSYVFNDMNNVYLTMKIINAFISSLIIFPAFFLAKEFLSSKKSFLFSILISVLPSNFSFSPYIMTENLFYPLFLTSIYFIYKSFKENKIKYDVLASIFIALSFLTRALGITLILLIPILIIFKLIKKEYNLKEIITKSLAYSIPFMIIISSWIIRNTILLNNELGIITNHYSQFSFAQTRDIYSLIFFSLIWIVLYLGFMILSSGVIFPFMHLTKIKDFFKDNRLLLLTIISYSSFAIIILIISRYNATTILLNNSLFQLSGRPIGRYLDVTLPLVILLGFISISLYKKLREKRIIPAIIITSIVLFASIRLVFFPLFPVNNLSLTWMGTLKYLIDLIFYNKQSLDVTFSLASFIIFILLFISILTIIILMYSKRIINIKNIFTFFIIFFLTVSLLNYGLTYYNSKIWYEGEQMQLGLWLNDYDPKISNILIDERDCTGKISKDDQSTLCEPSKSSTIIGFWLNDNIIIRDITNLDNIDFVITKHETKLELVKETNNGIKIYKVG
jgi:hypothetical protein